MLGSAYRECRGRRGNTVSIPHAASWVLEHGVFILHGGASVPDIRSENVRQRIPVATAAPTFNRNLRAVHIHLAVSLEIEPRPREERIAAGRRGWYREVVLQGEWAATNHAVDHFERAAVIVTQGELAGAAFVLHAGSERHRGGLAGAVGLDAAPFGALVVPPAGIARGWRRVRSGKRNFDGIGMGGNC